MTTKQLKTLSIEQFDIDLLKVDERNPRKHSPRQIKQIARSVESFGFNVPVLVDGENKVIAGHGRLLACRVLGITAVPIVRLEHLTPVQARAFSIADNKLTENGEWDGQLLGKIFLELSTQDLKFDLDITGFSIGEIDLSIEGALCRIRQTAARRPASRFDWSTRKFTRRFVEAGTASDSLRKRAGMGLI